MDSSTLKEVLPGIEDYLDDDEFSVGASYPPHILEKVRQALPSEYTELVRDGFSNLESCFPSLVFRQFPTVLRTKMGMSVSPISRWGGLGAVCCANRNPSDVTETPSDCSREEQNDPRS